MRKEKRSTSSQISRWQTNLTLGERMKGGNSWTERRRETWPQGRLDTFVIFFLLFLYACHL